MTDNKIEQIDRDAALALPLPPSFNETVEAFAAHRLAAIAATQRETTEKHLAAIAEMMGEFVDNWPAPKKFETAVALIAKTFRAARSDTTELAAKLADDRHAPWIAARLRKNEHIEDQG